MKWNVNRNTYQLQSHKISQRTRSDDLWYVISSDSHFYQKWIILKLTQPIFSTPINTEVFTPTTNS